MPICKFCNYIVVKELYWLLESRSPILSIRITRNFMGKMKKVVFIKEEANNNKKYYYLHECYVKQTSKQTKS